MVVDKKTITLKISDLRHPVFAQKDLAEMAAQRLGVDRSAITSFKIIRRATDARQRRVDFVYTVLVTVQASSHNISLMLQRPGVATFHEPKQPAPAIVRHKYRPVIVGTGPAGLFAALTLVERGVKPILLEQGERVPERTKRVKAFWERGVLHPFSNVLFGEGGAGTYSDGKLTTRIKSPFKEKVLKTLVEYGADPEILYDAKPHIGTDRLRMIIPALVDDLQRKGADFHFGAVVTDIDIRNGKVCGVVANETIETRHVFLATGHSSRDIFRMLRMKGVAFERKNFAVGLRIEHPQEFIDQAMIKGKKKDFTRFVLPASYTLTFKDQISGRGVYSFCMCPGGRVIGCAEEPDILCTNGMSTSQRETPWANAAIVVTVMTHDFMGEDPFAGVEFQTMLEHQAYTFGGGGFKAPVQTAADFIMPLGQQASSEIPHCSYRPGVRPADLRTLFPVWLREPLQRALLAFEKKIPGFISEGVLIGVETRTSCPLRIVRNPKTFCTPAVEGLIPIGEGSGYAGGIMSCAVDGICSALAYDYTSS